MRGAGKVNRTNHARGGRVTRRGRGMGPLTTADSVPVTRGAVPTPWPLCRRLAGPEGLSGPIPGPRRVTRPVTVSAFANNARRASFSTVNASGDTRPAEPRSSAGFAGAILPLLGRHRRGRRGPSDYRRSGATAACARSKNGAGMTPSCTTPQRATTTANDPATEGTMTAGAPSGSRMYM